MASNNSVKVYQYSKTGCFLREFQSMLEAEKETGVTNVWRSVKTGRIAGGFYWSNKFWAAAYVKRGKGRQFYGG